MVEGQGAGVGCVLWNSREKRPERAPRAQNVQVRRVKVRRSQIDGFRFTLNQVGAVQGDAGNGSHWRRHLRQTASAARAAVARWGPAYPQPGQGPGSRGCQALVHSQRIAFRPVWTTGTIG